MDIETQCIECNDELDEEDQHVCDECGQGPYCELCVEGDEHVCDPNLKKEDDDS